MPNASQAILEDADYYAHSDYLRWMLGVRIASATVAFILLTALHLKRHNFLAHPSLKILLECHFLWVYLTCVYVIADHGYTGYLLATMSQITDLLQTEHECMLRKGVHIVFMYGTVASMYAISFERRKASAHFQTYESTSRAYGFKLAIIHIVIVAAFCVGFLVTYGNDEDVVVLCTITTPRGEIYQQGVGSLTMVMELWTITSFIRLLKMNRIKKDESFCLTEKFQIAENLRMLGILLPIVWSHVVIVCVCLGIYFVGLAHGLTSRSLPLFEDSINNGFLIGFTMPYFFLMQFMEDSSHKREVIATNATTGEALRAVHSAVIQSRW